MAKVDLSKLTKEEKLKLLDALEERERRQKEKRSSYVPNEGQRKVHQSKALERYCFAGNGSGKSCMLVNEVLWAAFGYNPMTNENTHVPAKIVVVLDNPSKVEDVFLREMRKWYNIKPEQLEKRGKPYYSRINFPNGSTVDFFFHLQEEMTAESIEWHYLFFDEPVARKLFVALKRGGRSKEMLGRILLIGTPIAAAWLRKDVYEPWSRGERPNTECFKFSTHVNKQNLAAGYIEDFESVLSAKEREIRLNGSFFDLDGLALAHLFKRDIHVIAKPKWPNNWPCIVVVDPAQSKAHVAVLIGIKPNDDLVVLKELSCKKSPSEFARELRNWYHGFRIIDIVCDSMGSAGAYNADSFIKVLNDNGVRARATFRKEKNDEAWIANIQEALALPLEADAHGNKEPRLKVVEDCIGTIADIETVEWQKFRNIDEFKPKLAIEKKDFLACVKYALAAQPRFTKRKEQAISYRDAKNWRPR